MKKTTALRQLIHDPEILQLPICHDCLSAKVIEQAGFKAISAAGYGLAGSLLGMPDIAVLTGSEMITQVQEHLRCCPYTGVCRYRHRFWRREPPPRPAEMGHEGPRRRSSFFRQPWARPSGWATRPQMPFSSRKSPFLTFSF